jgi:hypothetical protein
MVNTIKLLEMAKLTSGRTLQSSDEFAVAVNDKIWVRHLDAYYPVIFEKDIAHRIRMLIHGAKNEETIASLKFLAYDLKFEEELEKE